MIRSPSTVTIITANSSFASQSSRNSAAAAYLIAPRPTTSYNQEKVRLNFEANASNSQQDDRKRGLTIEGKLQLVFRVLLLLVHLGPLRVILIEQAAYGWPTYFSMAWGMALCVVNAMSLTIAACLPWCPRLPQRYLTVAEGLAMCFVFLSMVIILSSEKSYGLAVFYFQLGAMICHIGLFVIGLSHWVSRKADEWEWVTATEI